FEEQAERTPDSISTEGNEKIKDKKKSKKEINENEKIKAKKEIIEDKKLTSREKTSSIQLTYRELNLKSNQLATLLQTKGVGPGTIVGIMVNRTNAMITAMLAILKAGGSYMPIAVDYPEERVSFMLADSGAGVLLVDDSTVIALAKPAKNPNAHSNISTPEVLNIHHLKFENDSDYKHQPSELTSTLAYIIYTSGTTGKPKGVMVEHRNVVNTVTSFAKYYDITMGSQVALLSEITFDASVDQVFGSLLYGATLHVIAKERLLSIENLRRYIREKQVGIINFVPSFIKELLAGEEK
ncbi:MAG: AMP-binding protein, partial [bacterium]|nr:AMP-binding protein [bacterium]